MFTQLNIYFSPQSMCFILISTRWHSLSVITKYFHAATDPENHGSQHQFQRNFTNNCKAPLESVCECEVINESVFVRYGICIIIATPHMPSSSLVTHERSNKLPSTSFAVLTNLWHLWSEWIICFHTWHQSGDELAQYNTISEALCKVWYIPARKLPGENPDPL